MTLTKFFESTHTEETRAKNLRDDRKENTEDDRSESRRIGHKKNKVASRKVSFQPLHAPPTF